MTAVDAQTGTITEILERPFREVKRGFTYFEEGDVIFAKITPCMQNGKHAVCAHLFNGFGFGSTEFHVLRPGPKLRPEWLHNFLRQPHVLRDAARHFTGAVGQQRVPESYLSELEIPLPSVAIQGRIAPRLMEGLGAIEVARHAAEGRLAVAESLPTAYLGELFQGLEAGSWKTERIGDVAPIQTGLAFKSGWFVEAGGVRILRNANIHQGFVEWTDTVSVGSDLFERFHSYSLNLGDIVLTLDRPIVANGLKVARLSKDDVPALLNQRVARLKAMDSRIDPDYLYAFLRSPAFTNAIRGHDQSLGVPHISPEQVGRVQIPLPSIAMQRSVMADLSGQLEAAESLIARCREELAAVTVLPAVICAPHSTESHRPVPLFCKMTTAPAQKTSSKKARYSAVGRFSHLVDLRHHAPRQRR